MDVREQFWKDLLDLVKQQADRCTDIKLCREIIDSIHDDMSIPAAVKGIWRKQYGFLRKQEECFYVRTQTLKCIQVIPENFNLLKDHVGFWYEKIEVNTSADTIQIWFRHDYGRNTANTNDWIVLKDNTFEIVSNEQFQKEFKKK